MQTRFGDIDIIVSTPFGSILKKKNLPSPVAIEANFCHVYFILDLEAFMAL
jgi:hypothetical protein